MRLVLLCGGSGSRLRPLSNEIRSKLFLDLLPAPDGGRESMIRRLCRQLDEAGMLSSALFVVRSGQTAILRSRIGGSGLIIPEPGRRGTFMAAALAAAYLRSVLAAEPDETVCIMPADPLVDASFFRTIARLPETLAETSAKLALIGAQPAAPSDQFGYIVPSGNMQTEGPAAVERFVEKPDTAEAARLIRRGALWNCGVFALKLGDLLAAMAARGLPDDYGKLLEMYDHRTADSFDREIAEHEPNAVVLRHSGLWQDLGNWESLSGRLGADIVGIGSISAGTRDTQIVNELHIPVHVIGVSGIIAAAGPDGILIADKARSGSVRDLPQFDRRPLIGEYDWGSERIVYIDAPDGAERSIALTKLRPGASRRMPADGSSEMLITVLSGSGMLLRDDGSRRPLGRGDAVRMEAGERFALQAVSTMEMAEVRIGLPRIT